SRGGQTVTGYAHLELGLHRRDVDNYTLELRYTPPEGEVDIRLVRCCLLPLSLDIAALRSTAADAGAYGKLLTGALFADAEMRAALAKARAAAQASGGSLRLQLFVNPGAPELHSLRWETLRDPEDGSPLLLGEQVLFSRYLSSFDWSPVRVRSKDELHALVVIANPTNLGRYRPGGRALDSLDVAAELARARSALGAITVTGLASGGSATLNNLVDHLRDVPGRGTYDVLYLVCHGAMIDGAPSLWLENEVGEADVVPGNELVVRLSEMLQKPRLVVLASCQSAGKGDASLSGDEGVLAALGPRLAEVGVPAVVAMQGNIALKTAADFMSVLFRELEQDGAIDRAVALARGAVRRQDDWWAPALFMRLKSGRLWYTPGFGEERTLEKWPDLLRNIERARCTPILGPALSEALVGSRREIAQKWADNYQFPMASHQREDLPQVAQYLAVNQSDVYVRDELGEYLRTEILRRYGDELPAEMQAANLEELIHAAGAWQRVHDLAEAHRVLAGLPFPILITTEPTSLLEDALSAAGKEPHVEICRWNDHVQWLPSIYDEEPDYRPTPQRPLVYHLFGRIDCPDSLVLTEDDYFDYLIGLTSNKKLVPGAVLRALADTALLFLGFHMDDWNFRVLFRSIMSQEGRARRGRYAHVAVQIDPEEGRILEPQRARRYLESYFQDADISIYWGGVEDFVRELQQRTGGGS
ncbi:MAG TPA: CHAT domain-containing protein, partial [Anaerolineae bacterium]|nr:CHAT domain-containing protein [Anaerolineae bacterium]